MIQEELDKFYQELAGVRQMQQVLQSFHLHPYKYRVSDLRFENLGDSTKITNSFASIEMELKNIEKILVNQINLLLT